MIVWTLVVLLGLLALGFPVAAVLGGLGLFLEDAYSMMPLYRAIGEIAWQVSSDFILLAIPLFILLGEIILRSGIAERMYAAMMPWLSWLPGGLMHSNIGACTLFSAMSGSSVATAATVGTVAVGEIDRHRYDPRLFLGTLAAGGTLGILIPPSINMIVYGMLTETSIPQLYLAGLLPGALLAIIFMATVSFACVVRPRLDGDRIRSSWRERIAVLPDLLPPILIFLIVIGSIYAGFATPTESAALGVLAALALALVRRRVNRRMMAEVFEGTMRTTAMIVAILLGANFLNFVVTSIGLISDLSAAIKSLGMSPDELMIVILIFYLILGMFMETLAMMVATVPLIVPIVIAAGFDPVWFGVMIMLLIETALITPPVGVNLFIVQGIRSRGQLHDIMIGALPFVAALLIMISLLVMVPGIALWIPDLVSGS
jgi:tripartite ATP-independent transporter DctM subunit